MYKLTVFTDSTQKIMTLQYNFEKNKKNLRAWAKTQRLSENFDKQNATILKNIKNSDIFCNAKNIMLFYPLKNELNLLDLLIENKVFSFPCLINDEIVPYKNNGQFKVGKFNITEPQNSTEVLIKDLDLIVVPALCVDEKGNRIGYGKGYYDRFIKTLNREKTKCIVAIWDDFVLAEICPESFDERIDYIFTEKRIIKI